MHVGVGESLLILVPCCLCVANLFAASFSCASKPGEFYLSAFDPAISDITKFTFVGLCT